jgi:hypothetical protein
MIAMAKPFAYTIDGSILMEEWTNWRRNAK